MQTNKFMITKNMLAQEDDYNKVCSLTKLHGCGQGGWL